MENNYKGKQQLIEERKELLETYLKADKENNQDELVKQIADIEYELNLLKFSEELDTYVKNSFVKN